jgi:hypothetical protein
LKTLAPAVGLTRFPIKFVVVTVFCLPLLAAAGIVWLQSRPAWRRAAVCWSWPGRSPSRWRRWRFAFRLPRTRALVAGANGAARLLFLAGGLAVILYQPRFPRKAGQLVLSFAFLFLSGPGHLHSCAAPEPNRPLSAITRP